VMKVSTSAGNVLFANMPFPDFPCTVLMIFAPVLLLLLTMMTTMIVLKLDEDKASILKFVESRMSYIAPNLSHMIGNNPQQSTKHCSIQFVTLSSFQKRPFHLIFSRMFLQVQE